MPITPPHSPSSPNNASSLLPFQICISTPIPNLHFHSHFATDSPTSTDKTWEGEKNGGPSLLKMDAKILSRL